MQYKYYFEVIHCLFVNLQSVTDDILFGGIPVLLRERGLYLDLTYYSLRFTG